MEVVFIIKVQTKEFLKDNGFENGRLFDEAIGGTIWKTNIFSGYMIAKHIIPKVKNFHPDATFKDPFLLRRIDGKVRVYDYDTNKLRFISINHKNPLKFEIIKDLDSIIIKPEIIVFEEEFIKKEYNLLLNSMKSKGGTIVDLMADYNVNIDIDLNDQIFTRLIENFIIKIDEMLETLFDRGYQESVMKMSVDEFYNSLGVSYEYTTTIVEIEMDRESRLKHKFWKYDISIPENTKIVDKILVNFMEEIFHNLTGIYKEIEMSKLTSTYENNKVNFENLNINLEKSYYKLLKKRIATLEEQLEEYSNSRTNQNDYIRSVNIERLEANYKEKDVKERSETEEREKEITDNPIFLILVSIAILTVILLNFF